MPNTEETEERTMRPRDVTELPSSGVRRAAVAGLVGPALFAVALALITWAEWEYLERLGFSLTDHGESAWPSGLAQGPHGWAQVVNYGVLGVLMLMFFWGLRTEFPRPTSRRVATALLTGSGVGFLLAASPEDGPPFGEPTTAFGVLHGVGFILIVLFTTSGMVATSVALRAAPGWRLQARLSALAAAATFFFLVVLVFALEVATTLGIYGFFATVLLWVELLALRLYSAAER